MNLFLPCKSIKVIVVIVFLLVTMFLLQATSIQAEEKIGKFVLRYKVNNAVALMTAKKDLEIVLNLSRTTVPDKTNLVISTNRVYPSLLSESGFNQFVHSFESFRFRKKEQPILKKYSMQANRGFPPAVSYYRIDLQVAKGQRPRIRQALGEALDKLICSRYVFVGAKSQALENVNQETQTVINAMQKMLEIYNKTHKSEGRENPGNPDDPRDRPRDREIKKKDDGKNAQPENFINEKYDARKGASLIRKLGGKFNQEQCSMTMPDAGSLVIIIRSGMVQILMRGAPSGSDPSLFTTEFDRYCAFAEIIVLRNAILYLHYYLNDAYQGNGGFDTAFESLVENPDPALQAKMLQEWQEMSQTAHNLWALLQKKYFNEKFMQENRNKYAIGTLPEYYFQKAADNMRFRNLVLKEKFTDTITQYIDLLDELQTAYVELLEKEREEADTIKIGKLKKRIEELDKKIRKQLIIKGNIKKLLKEIEKTMKEQEEAANGNQQENDQKEKENR